MTESLKKRFKIGQEVFIKKQRYFGNKSGYELLPTVLTKVGVKYLEGKEWWAKRILPSSVYETKEEYEAEVLRDKANADFRAQFNGWGRSDYTVEQIREACKVLGIKLSVFEES